MRKSWTFCSGVRGLSGGFGCVVSIWSGEWLACVDLKSLGSLILNCENWSNLLPTSLFTYLNLQNEISRNHPPNTSTSLQLEYESQHAGRHNPLHDPPSHVAVLAWAHKGINHWHTFPTSLFITPDPAMSTRLALLPFEIPAKYAMVQTGRNVETRQTIAYCQWVGDYSTG